MTAVRVRSLTGRDHDWVVRTMEQEWGSWLVARCVELGPDLCAVHRNAVAGSRELKPVIPLRDAAGRPIDHELEFELRLGDHGVG